MSEKTDWHYLRDKVRFPRDRWDRMENGVGVGMPDVNFCVSGCEGWLELKCPKEPVRAGETPLFGSNHRISQDQKNWFKRQVTAGGRCFFLIGTDKRWMLIHGKYGDVINRLTVNELIELADWYALRPIRDGEGVWARLREVLQK